MLPPTRLATIWLGVAIALSLAPAARATTLPAGFGEVDVTSGSLNSPTAVAFAPDGRQFVAEKSGRVRVVAANGAVAATPLLDIRAKVNAYSDRGMLGIATDKDFATNGFLYLLYVHELNPILQDSSAAMVSRLTRVTVRSDNTLENPASPETVILGKDVSGPCEQPDNLRDCIPADYYWHTIGTVRSDPVDGTLWVGSGDAHPHSVNATSYRPYDERTLAGKIIHIDRDGRGLAGHPFCPSNANLDEVCTKIYAKGFRNPFRFTLRPGKGPVVGDVGASDEEELDLVKPGRNYGWPCYEGSIRTPLYKSQARCVEEYAKEGTTAASTAPSWSYPHGSGASITGGVVYTGTRYPTDYRGDIFVGDYVQGWVKRLDVDAGDRVTAVHDFAGEWPTGVDLQTIPGGGDVAYVDLGYGAQPAGVRRFDFTGSTNAPPTARAAATPTSGAAPLAVAFSSAGSSDPDGDALTYSWQFGDGTPSSSSPNPSHTYTAGGTYTAALTVSDGQGQSDSETVTVTAGNSAPTASIIAPTASTRYRDGVAMALRGSGTDREDGALPESGYAWKVLLHHGSHVHEQSEGAGSQASFVPAVDHDADSYYEIRLTVTDSGALTHTTSVDVRPETSRVTLASAPAGAPLDYIGAQAAPAPFTREAAVGYRASVAAAESFVRDGVTYRFASWSDGGARQHEVTIPASDVTLTANYTASSTGGTVDTLAFTPEADTWVDASQPTASFGTSSQMRVDASPQSQAYLRFRVAGLAGRTVRRARLRLFQRDASDVGGRVFKMTSNSWTEAVTWNSRPAVGAAQVAAFGAVQAGRYYEVDLGPSTITGDGAISLGMDSLSSDGSLWGTRSFTSPPQLLVDVDTPAGTIVDGLSEVAGSSTATTNPTSYAGNRRLALTAAGRLLAVHGRSGQGVQLAWRNPSGGWQRETTGARSDGLLLSGTGTGDWPTSIAVARDAAGQEHAWVVWAGPYAEAARSLQMVRLSNLDAAGGPTVGATQTIDAPALGAYKPDVAFERAPDGRSRGVLVWSRRTGATTFEIVTGWFTDLASPTPAVTDRTVIHTSGSDARHGALVPGSGRTRVVARSSSALRIYTHPAGAPLASWSTGAVGAPLGWFSSPNGVELATGDLVAVGEGTTAGAVLVQRFAADGTVGSVELSLTGYRHPTIAGDGSNAWVVMVRSADGAVVSRRFTPGTGWSSTDRVEIPGTDGGHARPNAARVVDGRLRFLVKGTASDGGSAVLAFQRLK